MLASTASNVFDTPIFVLACATTSILHRLAEMVVPVVSDVGCVRVMVV